MKRDVVESTRLLYLAAVADNHRRAGRVCDRAVQRLRRRQERGRRRPLPAARGAPRQPDRAEPHRPCSGGRARDARRPGRSHQVAPDLQGRRRQRPETRRLHAVAEAPTSSPPRPRRRSRRSRRSGWPASRALDAAACGGQTHALMSHRSRPRSPVAMLRSALLNVMIKAARKAGRTLKRDFGEVEHLQVSLKGPANFVTAADRQGGRDPARGTAHRAPRLRLPRRGRRPPRGHRQDPHLGGRSARRHVELRARHPAFRDLDRARARRHGRRRADLQSRERRPVHRRARQGRLPQRQAPAGGGAPHASPTP